MFSVRLQQCKVRKLTCNLCNTYKVRADCNGVLGNLQQICAEPLCAVSGIVGTESIEATYLTADGKTLKVTVTAKGGAFRMFYIDFTSPEGKTYRIDVSEHPVHYECPICGGITIYTFDEDDEFNCPHCIERKRQQDYDEIDARLYEQLSNRINREYGCRLSPADTKQIIDDPVFRLRPRAQPLHPPDGTGQDDSLSYRYRYSAESHCPPMQNSSISDQSQTPLSQYNAATFP